MSLDDTPGCQDCGACCDYSETWPILGAEDAGRVPLIPRRFLDVARKRMRCDGDRCSALTGTVGSSVACAVYESRPEVCRACPPGSPSCRVARRFHGLEDASPGTILVASSGG